MLVRANKNIIDYGPVVRIKKGELCIVYAIEYSASSESHDQLYVIRCGIQDNTVKTGDLDPLYYDKEHFDIVCDLVSTAWITKSVSTAHGSKTITSFVEWFDNGFYLRAHDWDLAGEDYDIMRTYYNKYEKVYAKYTSELKH